MNYRIQKGIKTAGIVGMIVIMSFIQLIQMQKSDESGKEPNEDVPVFSAGEWEMSKEKEPMAEEKIPEESTAASIEESIQVSIESMEDSSEKNMDRIEEKEETLLYVHISGAVHSPDHVYTFPEGARIEDAVLKAGGLLEEADLTHVNLAEKLRDGMKIYIPRKGEAIPVIQEGNEVEGNREDGKSTAESGGNGLTNINSASIMELDSLPGIGPALAQRIIDYRAENGPFQNIDDLKQVKGIGDKLLEKIREKVTVGK